MASDDPVDPRFKDLLDQFERHIREDADLERLKVIRRQIRTALPLSVRRYLPAYLLQEVVGAGVPRTSAGRTAAGRDRPAATDRKPPRPAAPAERPAPVERPAERSERPAEAESASAAGPPAAREDAAPPEADGGGGEMARLFVSVGRSRRVSRQMLADLFVAKLDLPHDHLGEVRVLDNFSFIEVPSEFAQAAIDKISGETLNGRRVNVDYARSKKS